MRARRRSSFGAFELAEDGLRREDGTVLSWALIERVAVADNAVLVQQHGKALPWANVPLPSVTCPLLLLERLREHAVEISTGPLYIPEPMRADLHSAPRAKPGEGTIPRARAYVSQATTRGASE